MMLTMPCKTAMDAVALGIEKVTRFDSTVGEEAVIDVTYTQIAHRFVREFWAIISTAHPKAHQKVSSYGSKSYISLYFHDLVAKRESSGTS